jgi:uncharacterized membrane protein YidH (DUF202 family)
MDSREATELLGTTARLTALTRKARQAFWFPLVLFGILTLGSVPLYAEPADFGGLGSVRVFRRSFFDIISAPFAGSGGHRISLYWLVSLPAAYIATALYYRRRAARTGVAGSVRPYVMTGAALLASLFLLSGEITRHLGFFRTTVVGGNPVTSFSRATAIAWLVVSTLAFVGTAIVAVMRKRRTGEAGQWWPYVVPVLGVFAVSVESAASYGLHLPDLLVVQGQFFRGTTPLLAIALGLFVLAWIERSIGLTAFCVAFSGVALMSNLYNIENIFFRFNVYPPAPQVNVIVPGAMLLLAGIGFGVAHAMGRNR